MGMVHGDGAWEDGAWGWCVEDGPWEDGAWEDGAWGWCMGGWCIGDGAWGMVHGGWCMGDGA